MKKIVGVIKPFSPVQYFYIFEDGKKIETVHAEMNKVSDTVFEICSRYNIEEVDLTGPKQFNKKIAEEIGNKCLTQYKELVIKLI